MNTALDERKLKNDIVLILEENFDPHLQRIDDDSLRVLSLKEKNKALEVKVSYQEVLIRCCAGPSWETPIEQTLQLAHNGTRWQRSLG